MIRWSQGPIFSALSTFSSDTLKNISLFTRSYFHWSDIVLSLNSSSPTASKKSHGEWSEALKWLCWTIRRSCSAGSFRIDFQYLLTSLTWSLRVVSHHLGISVLFSEWLSAEMYYSIDLNVKIGITFFNAVPRGEPWSVVSCWRH